MQNKNKNKIMMDSLSKRCIIKNPRENGTNNVLKDSKIYIHNHESINSKKNNKK